MSDTLDVNAPATPSTVPQRRIVLRMGMSSLTTPNDMPALEAVNAPASVAPASVAPMRASTAPASTTQNTKKKHMPSEVSSHSPPAPKTMVGDPKIHTKQEAEDNRNGITPHIRQLHTVGIKLFNTLKYRDAYPYFVEIVNTISNKNSSFYVSMVVALATIRGETGYHKEGIVALTELLPNISKTHGEFSVEVGNIYESIASLHNRARTHDQQISVLESKVLPIYSSIFGVTSLTTMKISVLLANAYGSIKQYEKQKELLIEIIRVMSTFLPDDDIELIRARGNLANAYGNLGNFGLQIDIIETVLRAKEAKFGKTHNELGRTCHNLALAYGNVGKLDKKIELLERAVDIKTKHYEATNVEHIPTLLSLSASYQKKHYETNLPEFYSKTINVLTRAKSIIMAQPHPEQHSEDIANIDTKIKYSTELHEIIDIMTRAMKVGITDPVEINKVFENIMPNNIKILSSMVKNTSAQAKPMAVKLFTQLRQILLGMPDSFKKTHILEVINFLDNLMNEETPEDTYPYVVTIVTTSTDEEKLSTEVTITNDATPSYIFKIYF